MLTNYVTSFIRTLTPMIVGWLLSLPTVPTVLAEFHVTTPSATKALTGIVVFALAIAYYLLVRGIEELWPAAGVLLGAPAKPTYSPVATLTAPMAINVTPAPVVSTVTVAGPVTPVAPVTAPPVTAPAPFTVATNDIPVVVDPSTVQSATTAGA